MHIKFCALLKMLFVQDRGTQVTFYHAAYYAWWYNILAHSHEKNVCPSVRPYARLSNA